jgi:hypothetical protein
VCPHHRGTIQTDHRKCNDRPGDLSKVIAQHLSRRINVKNLDSMT